MKSFVLGALAIVFCLSTPVAVAQELKSLDGETEVFVLQLPKGNQDVLVKLNEILKGEDNYKLTLGTNFDPYSATTGATGGGYGNLPTEFNDPFKPWRTPPAIGLPSAIGLTKAEEGEIVWLCLTNVDPASYEICKKYNVTASLIGGAGGN